MDAANGRRTALSTGAVVASVLTASSELMETARDVIPVVDDITSVQMPCVVFRVSGLETQQVFRGEPADTAVVEISCCASDYATSVRLAETVRATLDGETFSGHGMEMRACSLTDAYNQWSEGIHEYVLVFEIKV